MWLWLDHSLFLLPKVVNIFHGPLQLHFAALYPIDSLFFQQSIGELFLNLRTQPATVENFVDPEKKFSIAIRPVYFPPVPITLHDLFYR